MQGHGPHHKRRGKDDKGGFCPPDMSARKSEVCKIVMNIGNWMLSLMGVQGASNVCLAKGTIACMAVGFEPGTRFKSHIEQARDATGAAAPTHVACVTNGLVLRDPSGDCTIASPHTGLILRVKSAKVRDVFETTLLGELTLQVHTVYRGYLMEHLGIECVGWHRKSIEIVNMLSACLFGDVLKAVRGSADGGRLLREIDQSLWSSSRQRLVNHLSDSYADAASSPQDAGGLGSGAATARPVSSLVSLVLNGGASTVDGERCWRKGPRLQVRNWVSLAEKVPQIDDVLVASVLETLQAQKSNGAKLWGDKRRFWAQVCMEVCVVSRNLAQVEGANIEVYLPTALVCKQRYDHPSPSPAFNTPPFNGRNSFPPTPPLAFASRHDSSPGVPCQQTL